MMQFHQPELPEQGACETCCLPSWDHLGTGNCLYQRDQQSSQLGVDSDRRDLADMLDTSSTYYDKLSGADQVFLQERLQPMMQMLPHRTVLHWHSAAVYVHEH